MSIWRRLALMVSSAVFVIALGARVFAQDGGSGLQVSPTRTELSVNPGEQKNFTVSIKNITPNVIVAKATLNDFESDGTTGEPRIIVDGKERSSSSLEKFLKGLSDVELAPNETKQLDLILDVPNDASPGAYYGAVRFTAIPKEVADNQDNRQIALTASVASLVLVEVSGEINEQLQLRSVTAQQSGRAGNFFLKSPDKVAVEVKNTGNSFSKPFGRVTVTNMSGKEVYSYEVNNKDPRGNVLPDSVRVFIDDLKNVSKPGRYTVNASVSHGSGGQVLTLKSSFWYIPAWLLVLLSVLALAVLGGAYFLYRKRFGKRSNR